MPWFRPCRHSTTRCDGLKLCLLGVAISIGNEGGVAAIMGSALIGSFVVIGASFYMDKVRKLFPTVVSGVVVTLIGLTILPVAMNWVGDSLPIRNNSLHYQSCF